MSSSINPDRQKNIQNQSRVSSSLYTMNISALNRTVNTTNEGVKHGSYERYLNAKKGKLMSKLVKNTNTSVNPISGNKTKPFTLTSYNKNCACDK